MRSWPRCFFAIFLGFGLACIAPAQSDGTARREYTVGVLSDNFPYAYFPADESEPVGFSVEILQAIREVSRLNLRFVVGTTRDIHERFYAGEIDALLAYAYSEERAERFAFTRPYLEMVGMVFVRPEDVGLHRLEDLRGRRVAVHPNSIGEQILRTHDLADSIVFTESVNTGMHRVAERQADATLATLLTGASIADRDRLDLVPSRIPVPDYQVDYCLAVQPDEADLLARLDEGLAVLYRTGRYEPIYQKWFGRLEPRRFTPVQVLLAVCGGLLVALVVALLAANHQRRLRRQLAATHTALGISAQHFREVFDATPVALIVTHCEEVDAAPLCLRLRDANPAAARLFGWADPPLGDDLRTSSPAFAVLWDRVAGVRPRTSPTPADLQLDRSDGETLHLRWSAVRDEKRLLLVLEDTTAQEKAAAELRTVEHNLMQSQKLEALGNLSSGIAHDFNNVLTSILGNAELLRLDLPAGSPPGELVESILRGSRRARDLVRQILAFSRQAPPERKPVDLHDIVNETVQLARAAIPRSIDLRIQEPDTHSIVQADGTQVHQVLLNLLTNAAQAIGDRPGTITLAVSARTVRGRIDTRSPFGLPPNHYHCVSVQDDGPGMPPEVLARACEPFFTTKQATRGTGLGLSVAHGVVTQHGGTLRLDSTPGRGTRAEVWLPASDDGELEAHLELIDVEPVATDQPAVMVVDDENVALDVIARMLRRLGCRPVTFANPLDALAAFAAEPARWRAVLCDLSMPERNGLDVLAEMRATRPGLPTLLMTGFWSNGSRDRARELGIDLLAEKPLSLAELHAHLTALLRDRSPGRG